MKKLFVAIFMMTSVLAWADTFQQGVAAFNKGDYTTALLKMTQLAQQGNAAAQYNIGQMYRNGQGVSQDYQQAVRWYIMSADQGYASAQYNLGLMNNNGLGVVQDYKEALRLYILAAQQGHANAQYNLGFMYSNGQGVAQDFVHAHKWFNLAAVNGDADAVKNRDIISRKMTSQQIAEAQHLARECQAKNFKNCY